MDAEENRYVAVTDIPGAFLHGEIEEEVHMLLNGPLQNYSSNLTQNYTGNKYGENKLQTNAIHMTQKGSVWDTAQVELFFWRLLPDHLKKWVSN
jgi:hypothetical protein